MPQTGNEKKTESSGRSIVEMLGVLAVIGVLSIGGIAGYRYAMNRHQANQALNEMNMASLQLAMQLQQGVKNGVKLALGEPFESGRLQSVPFGFAYVCGDEEGATKNCAEEETRYQLAVTNVPYGVCQQLTENISNLQYYDDMFINGAWDGDCQNDSDNEIAVLFNVSETASIAASGAAYYYTTYTQYTTDTEKKGACGENCKESEGKFCNAYSSVCTVNKSYDGGCLTAANYAKQGAQSGLVASNIGINSWWSAESFCKALGKRLVSLESLGCNKAIGACNTERVAQMKADFKNDYHFGWTSSFDGMENACNAYSIRLGTGDVNSVGRIYAYSEALCEDDVPLCQTASDCGAGQACVHGGCSDSCTADSQCKSDEHCIDGKCATCPDGMGWNESKGACEELAGKENQPCKAGLKCDDGLYCDTSRKTSDCKVDATTGVCKRAIGTEVIVNEGTGKERKFYVGDAMNWWSAERFCEALTGKKHRAKINSLLCADPIAEGGMGYCHETAAGNTNFDADNISRVIQVLQRKYSDITWMWLDEVDNNGCNAYYFTLDEGFVNSDAFGWKDVSHPALCE